MGTKPTHLGITLDTGSQVSASHHLMEVEEGEEEPDPRERRGRRLRPCHFNSHIHHGRLKESPCRLQR